ncbi:MAG: transcription-repair coupling factor [Erysipelotrichaceae bacterium]|jgi:transcription-repair coupling factor (superfamily II helicase)|nr:transcription-repair coupling factor [Erysipelotrichaceae bacterium]
MKTKFFPALKHLLETTSMLSLTDPQEIALFIAAESYHRPEGMIVCLPNLYLSEKVYSMLSIMIGKRVLFFPSDDQFSYNYKSASNEFLSERLYTLSKLRESQDFIIVTDIRSMHRFLPETKLFFEAFLPLKIKQTIPYRDLIKQLITLGYSKTSRVNNVLEFAARGSIIDVYPVNVKNPLRIEFFGDEVDSIREFKLATQESTKNLDEIMISPANDMLFSENEYMLMPEKANKIIKKYQQIMEHSKYTILSENFTSDFNDLLGYQNNQSLYKLYYLFKTNYSTLKDYQVNSKLYLINNEQLSNIVMNLEEDQTKTIKTLYEQGLAVPDIRLYDDSFKLLELDAVRTYDLLESGTYLFWPLDRFANSDEERLKLIVEASLHHKVVIVTATKLQKEIISDFCLKNDLKYLNDQLEDVLNHQLISLIETPFEKGFSLPRLNLVIFTFRELYNQVQSIRLYKSHFDNALILHDFEELIPGDFVVHEEYGIGKFIHVKPETYAGHTKDYLTIEYANEMKLKIPSQNFYLVRKFLGKEGYVPKLSVIGSKAWKKQKEKIAEEIDLLTKKLFSLYETRNQSSGFVFKPDTAKQKEFENSFEYELTRDQSQSLLEIKSDMESTRVMDRLLLGDVGFGKTEIAFRIAFKALENKKQVVMIAPTTLLAKQHYELAKKRFPLFGYEVALFSRQTTDKEKNRILTKVFNKEINFIIGTHRLLSNELIFNDLGLLIVDEEQKFGVEQKEKMKLGLPNIDVLSLSATPIPRTLSLSLLTIRSISIINTPPIGRVGIQTYVVKENPHLIKDVIERELSRKGQVFYLHNRISSLEATAKKLLKLVPGLRIAMVHGQMTKDDSDLIMTAFYDHQVDLLLATSIIENGIDVPAANTIIIENADRFGLSDLYQIKGRVGRGSDLAYAYFMYQDQEKMTDVAKQRLKTLTDFTKLGSGYEIAKRDLAIRGAGDLLGKDQAGFINTIGISLYNQLLKQAIDRQGQLSEKEHHRFKKVSISAFDAFIDSAITSNNEKYSLYLEIIDTMSLEELASKKRLVIDQYGAIPDNFMNIFTYQAIGILSLAPCFESIRSDGNLTTITLATGLSSRKGIVKELEQLFLNSLLKLRIIYDNHHFKIIYKNDKNLLKKTKKCLELINSFYNSYNHL